MTIIKTCKVHGELTIEQTYKSINRIFCKSCHDLASKNWRERNTDKIKKNYILNKDMNIKRAAIWNKENTDRRAKISKKNYHKFPEKELLRRQSYYSENKDKLINKKLIHYYNNPDYDFKLRLKRYGLTEQQYLDKAELQNYLCEICQQPEVSHNKVNNKLRRLSVDHCHRSQELGIMKVRGLLCSNCNMTLGRMKENILYLESMIKYIKKYTD